LEVESLFAAQVVELKGPRYTIGSQIELYYSYEDLCPTNQPTDGILEVNVILKEKHVTGKKRSLDARISYRWNIAEKNLFEEAYKRFAGEPHQWLRMAEFIGTRNEEQVRAFGRSQEGMRYISMQSQPLLDIFKNVSEGLNAAAQGARQTQKRFKSDLDSDSDE
jgi:hypothetical protein